MSPCSYHSTAETCNTGQVGGQVGKSIDDERANNPVAEASALGRKRSDECQTHLMEALAEKKQQRL